MVRLLRTVATLFGVVLLTFVLGRLSGDPVAMLLPQTATKADYEAERARLGLDQPLLNQFALYLRDLSQGNLGTSINFNRPALAVVMERVPQTIALGLPAMILSILLGVPLGILAAYQRGKWADHLSMTLSLIGQSLPSFALGILLILVFSEGLRLLPTSGNDGFAHFIMPTLTLTVYTVAILIRLTRSAMLEVLGEDYVRTAHAKGVRRRGVLFMHTLRNALIPIVTVTGLQVAAIISGAAIVENVFAWPGIGSLAVRAINGRDFPIVQTIVLLSAAAFAVTNFLIDLLYIQLDPRIQEA